MVVDQAVPVPHSYTRYTPGRCFPPHSFFLPAVQGSGTGGINGAKHGSTSSAVAAKLKLSQKGSAVSSSGTSGGSVVTTAAAAAAAASVSRGTTRGSGNNKTNGAKGSAAAGKKGIALDSSGRVDTDALMYAETLAFLSSPPQEALKGVGPKRGEQLAKLGRR